MLQVEYTAMEIRYPAVVNFFVEFHYKNISLREANLEILSH